MSTPTASALRTRHRRIDRRLASAGLVLDAMRAGAALHLQFTRSGPIWTLTTGTRITDDVARLVIAISSVVGVGDALLEGALSQTYRWWSTEDVEGSAA